MKGNILRQHFFILLLAFLAISPALSSQPYYFRHYQVEQGLSHNSVSCILQDKKGFLWFGTKDGLNRFDGYSFKVFRNDPQAPTSIGSNYVLNLHESNGHLWAGTDKGLYQYNEKTEKFILLEGTLNHYIRDIEEDKKGNLLFIADFTLFRFDTDSKSLLPLTASQSFEATSLCLTPSGDIWVSTTSGLISKYNATDDTFESYNVFEHSQPTATTWIEKIYSTGDGAILIGTQSQGIKFFDTSKAAYQDILPYDQDKAGLFIRDFEHNTNNEYWIATEAGIYLLDLGTGNLQNLRKSYNDPYSLSDNAVYAVYQDKEGGIWAGTYFGGISYYPKQYTSFRKFFPKIGENAISGNAVREICQDQYGNVWIGTEDAGLNKYEPGTNFFTHFKPTGDKKGISHYNIHGLLARGDELWIGTFHHGLDVMDIPTGKIIRHYSAGNAPGSLKSNFIYTLYQSPSGKIFLGTSYGLYQYQEESDDFKVVKAFPLEYHYTSIIEDKHGALWAGTYMDGVLFYNPKTSEKGYFKNDPANSNSLSSNAINDIFIDSHQNLWITTANGLNLFNPQEKKFKKYSTKNGLPSNVIYRILEDKKQNFWVSTSKGLVWFNPTTEAMEVFTKANGLLSDQLNYSSSYQDQMGRMYFGTVKGLVSFKPEEFKQNTFIPPVYLTGIQVQDKELRIEKRSSLTESITSANKITLPYNQSSLSLDFAALSYTAPQIAEYAYKLEGLDKDWTYLKTNRKVFFTELPPGQYTFMVKATNSSGLWKKEAATLNIEISPPFWASSWAYFLYSLIGISLTYYLVYSYHKKAERKNLRKFALLENEKEKEIYQAKIEFFTTIAHEIRTPLTLISGPLEKAIKTAHGVPEIKDSLCIMKKNTIRLLDLTNQLLDFRKTEIKGFSLNFIKVDVTLLLKETFLRFKPAAEQKSFIYSLELPETPVIAYIDREAFIKTISNLLNNALKYGCKEVLVQLMPLEKEKGEFTIKVFNDGTLIPAQMKEKIFEPFFRLDDTNKTTGTGIGLSLSRSLAELHSGALVLLEEKSGMNVFVLSLPLHQEKEFHLYEEPNIDEAEPLSSTAKPATSLSPAILLVEDNKDLLEFISGELHQEYAVHKACSGKKALEILKTESIQLIVSDVMMNGMDGFELCKSIKSNVEYSHIPIILLTAKHTLQAKMEGLESGADAYMEKPFSPEHLRVQITNLLTNRNKIKDFFSSSPLAHIKSIAYSKADENFLEELNKAIHKNLAERTLNVDFLADMMNMSRPTLYRKIKAISNLTPNELINLARLKKAAELLAEGDYKMYEIAEFVGYSSQSSFGRNFLKQFGMTPSEYAGTKGTAPIK